jgi:hypothetical protein
MSNPNILDLDNLIPDQRIIKLAGKEIDVSKIPSRVTLEIAEKADVLESGSAKSFPLLMDMIIKIMNDPEVTEDWLMDNTSVQQLLALINFILEPIKDQAQESEKDGKTGKNEQNPNQ